MLKKISVDQLRPGMYVHELCGSWIDHPFWKSAFKLTDARQLSQLRRSKVREVWIDTDKGADLPQDAQGEGEGMLRAPAAATASSSSSRPEAPTAFREEVVHATRIVAQARGAVQSLFQDLRMGKALDAEHCLPVVDDITRSVSRNPRAIVSLARLKTNDDYTYMHSVAVCALMVALARQMGLGEGDTREAGMAGLVHDLGKVAMPQDVLNKPGKLTDDEYAIMKGHPQAGHEMLVEARGVGPVPLDVCLHHHEKVNGRGYPHGLQGDQISRFAKMGAVCDVYDAITSNRPYKAGWDPGESIRLMAQWTKEGHFDEAVFQAFVKSIGIYPVGSLVRLRSGRLGVVIDQGEGSLLLPRVKAFYAIGLKRQVTPELVDLGASGCGDQIESRESPAAWGLDALDHLWLPPAAAVAGA